jgi:hypothetical protein
VFDIVSSISSATHLTSLDMLYENGCYADVVAQAHSRPVCIRFALQFGSDVFVTRSLFHLPQLHTKIKEALSIDDQTHEFPDAGTWDNPREFSTQAFGEHIRPSRCQVMRLS